MKHDLVNRFLLSSIAAALVTIAVRPYVHPAPVRAQDANGYPFYVEPGVQTLRAPDGSQQVLGKVMIDLRNGKVWGFPTLSGDPYPSNPLDSKPKTSHPFLLGRFALSDTEKP